MEASAYIRPRSELRSSVRITVSKIVIEKWKYLYFYLCTKGMIWGLFTPWKWSYKRDPNLLQLTCIVIYIFWYVFKLVVFNTGLIKAMTTNVTKGTIKFEEKREITIHDCKTSSVITFREYRFKECLYRNRMLHYHKE